MVRLAGFFFMVCILVFRLMQVAKIRDLRIVSRFVFFVEEGFWSTKSSKIGQ